MLCKKKKAGSKMIKVRSHWTCLDCTDVRSLSPVAADRGESPIKVLNLYAGIGGNRKLWKGVHVTAVELNIKVAAAYKELYPGDTIIIGDAHQYLLKNYKKFDIIWASPPCPTHSRINYFNESNRRTRTFHFIRK